MNKYHIVGIGAGPANLSLSALLFKLPRLKARFIEKQKYYDWHAGMLLPEAKLQVSYLKDLVTLVDPTNPYSYINYLHSKGCLYQFITADFEDIKRNEFADYLRWVFNSLGNIDKGNSVVSLQYNGKNLQIKTSANETLITQNLVLGTGLKPFIPESCRYLDQNTMFHSSEFMLKERNLKNKKVAIVGGGQSAAEIVEYFLSKKNIPGGILWLSQRANFLPIDDSPFTNELFLPAYSHYFFSLPAEKKKELLLAHDLASNGISESTAISIYRHLYELKYIKKINADVCTLLPAHKMIAVEKTKNNYIISVRNLENAEVKQYKVDVIILCTGYKYQEPEFLNSLLPLIHRDKYGLIIDENYRLQWEGQKNAAIYIQNGARHTHGIADPNLSLLAFRSAKIINQIANKKIYKNFYGDSLIEWRQK